MAKIIDLLHTEYTIAYIVRKYTRPSIYPKIVTSKPLSSFTEDEKNAILKKYSRWYVYYSFEHPTAKTSTGQPKKVPQTPIYFNVNQDYKDFDERLKFLKMVRNSVEKFLKDGFSPYETGETTSEHTALSALDFALEIKRPEVKETTFSGYETRINLFKKYLKSQGYSHFSIKDINKSIVSQYLRTIKNATHRNNSKGALSAIFTVLSSEDLIPVNFIKEIQNSKKEEKPVRIYTEEDVNEISTLLKQHDQTLLMFIKFVSFMFWRPIEILRIRIEDVNFEKKYNFG